jgi:hypothetical protein
MEMQPPKYNYDRRTAELSHPDERPTMLPPGSHSRIIIPKANDAKIIESANAIESAVVHLKSSIGRYSKREVFHAFDVVQHAVGEFKRTLGLWERTLRARV